MAETSYFWKAGVTPAGDEANPYTDDEFTDFFSILNLHSRTSQGVLFTEHPTYDSLLAVSSTGGANVRVATGAAFVDGKMYYNTANVDNNVSGATVYWVVGLRKDWTAQTVRVFTRGNYASRALALASLVQTDGTTWEIPLATVLTTAGGNVDVITDERTFVFNMGAMVKIAEQTIFPSVGNFTFTNIPQCFSTLRITGDITASTTNIMAVMRFNSDSGSNYYHIGHVMTSADDAVAATLSTPISSFLLDVSRTGYAHSVLDIYITMYSSASYYSSILSKMCGTNAAGVMFNELFSGTYRNTGPVTRIDISGVPSFEVGSRVTLYGMA